MWKYSKENSPYMCIKQMLKVLINRKNQKTQVFKH